MQWRIYPVVIINPEDEWRNSKNDSVISQSIAIRNAVCLMKKISSYTHYTHNVDEYYVRQDTLKLLELGKYINNKNIEKSASEILNALNELSRSKNE